MKANKLSFVATTLLFVMAAFTSCKKDINEIIKGPLNEPATTRAYYTAAEEAEQDYAPTGINQITASAFGSIENTYLQNDTNRIGRKNIKAIYREYTDANFTTLKPKESADISIVGPIIKAEADGSIKVVFKKKATFPFSIHPHGVVYDAANEGIMGWQFHCQVNDHISAGMIALYDVQ